MIAMKSVSSEQKPSVTDCLGQDRLGRYLAGRIDEPSSDAIELHLSRCSKCETTLAELEKETGPVFKILTTEFAKPPAADPEVQQAINHAKLMNAPEQTPVEQPPAALQAGRSLGPFSC
jgi:anti-sigma factor RsiW